MADVVVVEEVEVMVAVVVATVAAAAVLAAVAAAVVVLHTDQISSFSTWSSGRFTANGEKVIGRRRRRDVSARAHGG